MQKAIIVSATVAEKTVTVFAVPHCLMSLLLIIMTVIAAVTFFCSTYRKMGNTESLDRLGSRWTARTFLTAILPNKFPCKVSTNVSVLLVFLSMYCLYNMKALVMATSKRNQNMYL